MFMTGGRLHSDAAARSAATRAVVDVARAQRDQRLGRVQLAEHGGVDLRWDDRRRARAALARGVQIAEPRMDVAEQDPGVLLGVVVALLAGARASPRRSPARA